MDSQKHPLVKQAYSVADMQSSLQKQLAQEGMRDILSTVLLGAGIAGTLRGGQGLLNLLSRGNKPLRTRSGISSLRVPVSADKEEEEKEAGEKQAFKAVPDSVTNKNSLWWYMPSLLAAGAGGAYGGWKLIDNIMDKRRRGEVEDELEAAKADYRDALESHLKEGSDSELGNALDALYDKMEKVSFQSLMPSANTLGGLGGAYATYAIPSALLGYLVVKNMTDKGSKRKVLEKAQKRRASKRQKTRPTELYAVPDPIEDTDEE